MEGLIAVTPKRDCPHCLGDSVAPKEEFKGTSVHDQCGKCENVGENWICL